MPRPFVLLGRDILRRIGCEVAGRGAHVARRDPGCKSVDVVLACPHALSNLQGMPISLHVRRPENVVELREQLAELHQWCASSSCCEGAQSVEFDGLAA